jgi:RHS repeat-associated protein
VVNSYDYDAYGIRTLASETVHNPFGFSGEYTDVESGHIYFRARYYDPATQQFLTRDPLRRASSPMHLLEAVPSTLLTHQACSSIPCSTLAPSSGTLMI